MVTVLSIFYDIANDIANNIDFTKNAKDTNYTDVEDVINAIKKEIGKRKTFTVAPCEIPILVDTYCDNKVAKQECPFDYSQSIPDDEEIPF